MNTYYTTFGEMLPLIEDESFYDADGEIITLFHNTVDNTLEVANCCMSFSEHDNRVVTYTDSVIYLIDNESIVRVLTPVEDSYIGTTNISDIV